MTEVHVDSRKWPERLHWQFSMERLGEDENGVWLHAPTGTVAQRGEEPPITFPAGFVMLVPCGRWWFADFYYGNDSLPSVYVNIGTPPEWYGDRVTQIDLDLDVVRRLNGTVEVLDEAEFLDNQVRYGYPQELIDGARAATATTAEMLERNAEPFDAAADHWLHLVANP